MSTDKTPPSVLRPLKELLAQAIELRNKAKANTEEAIETNRAIGEIIHNRRQLAGISLKKMGKAMGMTQQAAQRYEKGEIRWDQDKIDQVLGLLEGE